MIVQLLIGSLIISLTIAIHVAFIGAAIWGLTRAGQWLVSGHHIPRLVIALVATTLWLLTSHSVGVWIWAITFFLVGAFDALEPAVYFSVVSFTTLGFGDITLSSQWRITSGMCAANGLVLFGPSTAFLVEFLSRLRKAQEASKPTDRNSR